MSVSGGVSVSDQRSAARVGGPRERERNAERSRPTPSASRVPLTNSLTLTPSPTPPAIRRPAFRAARNLPTGPM